MTSTVRFALLSLPLVAIACGAPSDRVGHDEAGVVVGERDFVRVLADGATVPEKYRPLLDAFGKYSTCTVTHVGKGLVVTAGHCFNASPSGTKNERCSGTIDWGYRRDEAPYHRSRCMLVLDAEWSVTRDYALVVVADPPPFAVTVDRAARPALGHGITMFSHPLNRPLEWSRTCTVQPPSNLLEIGSDGTWGGGMFTHQCDSERGSSGAAIIDDASLSIVGIHNGGVTPWNYATYVVDTPLPALLDPSFNVPPVLDFDAGAPIGTARGTIEIPVTAIDSEGHLAKVRYSMPGGATVDVTEAPFVAAFDTTTVADGSYVVRVTAIDELGAETSIERSLRVANH